MANRLETVSVTLKPSANLILRLTYLTVGLASGAFAIQAGTGNRAHAKDKKVSNTAATEIIDFRDVSRESGVVFRFDTGSRGKHDLPEIMGGGVALFDADGDGRLDIYLCNGGPIQPGPGKPDPPCRLFRNLGDWHFEDITDRAGAPGPSYAMGAAVGDYDGDGRIDLLRHRLARPTALSQSRRGPVSGCHRACRTGLGSLEHVGGVRGSRRRRRPGPLCGELSRF